ncbi:uncharacterized protein B0H18DRAFT_55995 [Fomitopsis serialis]|uniref:uncharacterized protein n=1 Tax=Fomitopsis serialis TaxID=139415 RepID=UPI002008AF04|nr:uncharacterized protein B0H18DRAFT_49077 [Neoantrodia serialis]XP_047897267.1 uncharacterized protein B0H18DRAFT_55995 [Neoantrodia serialis]KAH9916925.1 hypothetical protein B0H18DRAFT_49077 [Neoantrodia serialis]KAH9932399.1 hypothetical protein B0H18DRAFT_55995 [Neoantrodia serialis]
MATTVAENSRAVDISCLLDPAYTRAYVDHQGDLDDPSYCNFPVFPTPTRRIRTDNSHCLAEAARFNAAFIASHMHVGRTPCSSGRVLARALQREAAATGWIHPLNSELAVVVQLAGSQFELACVQAACGALRRSWGLPESQSQLSGCGREQRAGR